MRDPVDAKIEEAREAAREYIRIVWQYGLLLDGREWDPDSSIRRKAEEAIADLPTDVQAYLRRLMLSTQEIVKPGYFDVPPRVVPPSRPLSSPPGRRKNTRRDTYIALAVRMIVTHHGLAATRNEATRNKTARPSACSIVADILAENGLDITESAIAAIWSRRHDL